MNMYNYGPVVDEMMHLEQQNTPTTDQAESGDPHHSIVQWDATCHYQNIP